MKLGRRNVLSKAAKAQSDAVAAMVRTIFVQPSPAVVGEQVRVAANSLRGKFLAVVEMLDEVGADVTAFVVFPEAHDEWQFGQRRYLSESSMALLIPPEPIVLSASALYAAANTTGAFDTIAELTA